MHYKPTMMCRNALSWAGNSSVSLIPNLMTVPLPFGDGGTLRRLSGTFSNSPFGDTKLKESDILFHCRSVMEERCFGWVVPFLTPLLGNLITVPLPFGDGGTLRRLSGTFSHSPFGDTKIRGIWWLFHCHSVMEGPCIGSLVPFLTPLLGILKL